jgi:hypothetical protein
LEADVLSQTPVPFNAEILRSWQGDYPVAGLHLLPEKQRNQGVGFIDDSGTFENVWEAFKPGDALPEVDFNTSLVLFVRNTQFYNRISIGRVIVSGGISELLAMETLSAVPIEGKVGMAMVAVPRRGIAAVRSADAVLPLKDGR